MANPITRPTRCRYKPGPQSVTVLCDYYFAIVLSKYLVDKPKQKFWLRHWLVKPLIYRWHCVRVCRNCMQTATGSDAFWYKTSDAWIFFVQSRCIPAADITLCLASDVVSSISKHGNFVSRHSSPRNDHALWCPVSTSLFRTSVAQCPPSHKHACPIASGLESTPSRTPIRCNPKMRIGKSRRGQNCEFSIYSVALLQRVGLTIGKLWVRFHNAVCFTVDR